MTRNEWKAAYGAARKAAHAMAGNGVVPIGRAYWSMLKTGEFGRVIHPSIIRDRSPQCRVMESLHWAARYRRAAHKLRNSSFHANLVANHKRGARLCVDDARAILVDQSAFHALP